ncbi:hypothetical protein FHU38_000720 [Saccharomonospora amisosensis]|uniref:Uncharacterized protein n=1 Tax=Saccharomonospora amisosensis TaxID=1128677 RepID=A0A7X5ZPD9_9PSEU|nr:hypothetical protein [Saccharomonospora amisosensis]NIJ10376.1 hypothetical protein [Saccharomonospora amisosensis]
MSGSGSDRVYAASVRRTDGLGRNTLPSKCGATMLAGTSAGPRPEAASAGTAALCWRLPTPAWGFGFAEHVDTERMRIDTFDLRKRRIIP